ncbi:MAG: hypothetical protein HUN04_25970 [Desulfobacter sp.]|nr:MAG: hypothetical protein HUN04_25970 [Desulfobacter sp.]
MALSSEEIAALVFKQAVQSNIGELALDGPMLSVLMQFDGKKTLGQVAGQLSMSMTDIRPVVAKLVESRLIQRVSAAVAAVDQDFMDFLTSQMAIAIGPLGGLIIEDSMEILGYAGSHLPTRQAAELVNLLSREIPREEKRIEFKQAMLQKIREKGYL